MNRLVIYSTASITPKMLLRRCVLVVVSGVVLSHCIQLGVHDRSQPYGSLRVENVTALGRSLDTNEVRSTIRIEGKESYWLRQTLHVDLLITNLTQSSMRIPLNSIVFTPLSFEHIRTRALLAAKGEELTARAVRADSPEIGSTVVVLSGEPFPDESEIGERVFFQPYADWPDIPFEIKTNEDELSLLAQTTMRFRLIFRCNYLTRGSLQMNVIAETSNFSVPYRVLLVAEERNELPIKS